MRAMGSRWFTLLQIGAVLLGAGCSAPPQKSTGDLPLEGITLPPGFAIQVFARDLPKARGLALGDKGTLFVGTYGTGKVYAIAPDGKSKVLIEGLQDPNGVAFHDGGLYVAEPTRILRYDAIEQRLDNPPQPATVCGVLPKQRIHGLRAIHFGPDGMLYVPIGSRCNICREEAGFAVLTRLDVKAENPTPQPLAVGVRDTQGFDWHPQTGELWFTDNGRDGLGNDAPADEINRLSQAGMHFGFPFCHGANVIDPEFAAGRVCGEFTPPAWELPAHSAPLGMRFYTGKQFPPEYRDRLFVTEHGSSDRESKIGSRVTTLTLQGNLVVKYEPFAEGWLRNNQAWGRPVDVLIAKDGALLVSDDKAGVVYRIAYIGK